MLRIASIGILLITSVILLTAWLFFSSSLFLEKRQEIVAGLLSDLTGSEVTVSGDVSVRVGALIRIAATDLEMPSRSMPGTNFVQIGNMEIALVPGELLKGRLKLTGMDVAAAQVNLLIDESGKRSWVDHDTSSGNARTEGAGNAGASLIAFLRERTLRATDFAMLVQDAKSGFNFDLQLEDLKFDPATSAVPFTVRGKGILNGDHLIISGDFPSDAPFSIGADFEGGMQLGFDGTAGPAAGDYKGRLEVDFGSLDTLLSVLGLDRELAGSGRLGVDIEQSAGDLSLRNIDALASLDDGRTATLKGDFGDLLHLDDVDLEADVRLFPPNAEPPPAKFFKDLRFTGFNYTISGPVRNNADSSLRIRWNGLEIDTGGIGPAPILIEEIQRTPEGRLKLGKVELRVGVPTAPILTLDGSVGDALRLRDFDIDGRLSVPVVQLLKADDRPGGGTLGVFRGGFRIDENDGNIKVTGLRAAVEETSLWSMSFQAADTFITKDNDLGFRFAFGVPDAARLLTTVGLKRVDLTNLDLAAEVAKRGGVWTTDVSLGAGGSRLQTDLDLREADGRPVVRGRLDGETVRLADLGHTVAAVREFLKIDETPDPGPDREVQPLIMPTELERGDGPDADDRPVEPLLMKDASERELAILPDGRVVQPLVLPENKDTVVRQVAEFQFVDDTKLLRDLDLDYAINIRQVVGLKGVSSFQSDLAVKEGQARLGPIDFTYGGGHFRLDGAMNLIDAPEIVALKGSTGGWDFQNILTALGVDFAGRGVLSATFNLAGNRRSPRRFLETMSGSAMISMRNGAINNTVLDLAGLGILPWLFSSQRRAGYVDIACLNAPLSISRGRILSDPLVAETRDVQLVAKVEVDLPKDTLFVEGRPRKVGEPLSRSPWPFTLSGAIDDPKLRVRSLPSWQRRKDGADRMPENRAPCVPDIAQLR